MIKRLGGMLLLLIAICGHSFANSQPPKRAILYVAVPDAQQFTMRYYVPVGSVDEKVPGLAHYVEHMVFKHNGGKTSKALTLVPGVNTNASTSHQVTTYMVNTPPDGFDRAIEFFLSVHEPILLTDQDIELERSIVLQEIAQRTESDPDTPFVMAYQEELMAGTLQAKWPGGTAEDIRKVNRNDVESFVRDHYIDTATFMLIAGPPPTELMLQTLRKRIPGVKLGVIKVNGPGKLEFLDEELRDYPGIAGADPEAVIEVANFKREAQSTRNGRTSYSFGTVFKAPTNEIARFASLILNDALSSRLSEGAHEVFIERDDALLTNVYIGLNDSQDGLWTLSFWGMLLPGVDHATVRARADAYLQKIADEGISQRSFERLKARYFLRVPWEDPMGRAELAANDMINYGYDQAINWRAKMDKVTHADVQALAKLLTRKDRQGAYVLKGTE